MNFCWCTITTNDIEDSIKFYSEIVGLEISSRFSPRVGMDIVFLQDKKGNEIELIKYADKAVSSQKSGISIGFEVNSLDETISLVKSYGIAIEGPFSTPAVKFIFVKDPNGVSIQFVEKLSNHQ
jgi:lactoylglutathione lyase